MTQSVPSESAEKSPRELSAEFLSGASLLLAAGQVKGAHLLLQQAAMSLEECSALHPVSAIQEESRQLRLELEQASTIEQRRAEDILFHLKEIERKLPPVTPFHLQLSKKRRLTLSITLSIIVVAFLAFRSLRSVGKGFLAEYYKGTNLEGSPFVTCIEREIYFASLEGFLPQGTPATNFSARWKGSFVVSAEGEYYFAARSDDGMRLWVDEKLLIDAWSPQSGKVSYVKATLTPGQHSIRFEYFQDTAAMTAKLYWKPPGGKLELLSAKHVSPN